MNAFQFKNRILAVFLCVIVVGGVAGAIFLKGGEQAEAAVSLPGIVELKASGDTFTILEIVPDVSQSAFAWYVGGAEPVNAAVLGAAYVGNSTGLIDSYQRVVDSLVGEDLLLSEQKNTAPSAGILQYLGEVKTDDAGAVVGGFENNEWFLRYVLDWTEDEVKPEVKVSTVSPKNVTVGHVEIADMVVISGGYYYMNSETTPETYSTNPADNLKDDVKNAILDRISYYGEEGPLGLPLVLDRRAYNDDGDADLNSNALFHHVLGGDPKNNPSGVYGSTFYFSAYNSQEELGNSVLLANEERLGFVTEDRFGGFLVTPQFNSPFDESAYGTFEVVLKSIRLENSLRDSFTEELLAEEITMASVIRYLIGDGTYNGSLQGKPKSEITILSLQPGDSSGVLQYNSSAHDQFQLTSPSTPQVSLPTDWSKEAAADQVSWTNLENWTGVSRKNITVVEMSISEFVRDDSNLSGKYDMIYIGNDFSSGNYGIFTEGSNFSGKTTNASKTYFAPVEVDGTTLRPGYRTIENDITSVMYQAMLEFAQAGRPVILAPYLSGGLYWSTNNTQPAAVAIESTSNLYTLLNQISGLSNVMRQDILVAGADGQLGTGDDSGMWETCQVAVHLPRPTIVFANHSNSVPVSYVDYFSEDENGVAVMSSAGSQMSYIFKIQNTLSSTTGVKYEVALSFDLDGDGEYEVKASELATVTVDQLITTTEGELQLGSSGSPEVEISGIAHNNLLQDQYYHLYMTLPTSVSGVIAMKLEVSVVGTTGTNSSECMLTYVQGAPRDISILQINGGGTEATDLQMNTLYQQLMGNSSGDFYSAQVAQDFDFTVHTIYAEDFEGWTDYNVDIEENYTQIATFAKQNGWVPNSDDTGAETALKVLACYDLVLVGFGQADSLITSMGNIVLKDHLGRGNKILFSGSDIDEGNLPQFTGAQSLLSGQTSLQSAGVSLIAGGSMAQYPFLLDVSIDSGEFFLEYNPLYYSNIEPVLSENFTNDELEQAKLFINGVVAITARTLTEEDMTRPEEPEEPEPEIVPEITLDYVLEFGNLLPLG